MAGDKAGSKFSVDYLCEPEDLGDLLSTNRALRARRAGMVGFLALITVLTISETVFVVLLARKPSANVPASDYWLGAIGWFLVFVAASSVWRLAPFRLARRSWHKQLAMHGRHHAEVGPGGILATGPDGTRMIFPWSALVRIHETDRSFQLLGRDGKIRVALPKRGLPDPAMVPVLSDFLNRTINPLPSPVSARTPDEKG